jgi:hypothetical protein
MEASGGFDIPEPVDEAPEERTDSPQAPEASDFAPGQSEELRRDKPDSDDDLQ